MSTHQSREEIVEHTGNAIHEHRVGNESSTKGHNSLECRYCVQAEANVVFGQPTSVLEHTLVLTARKSKKAEQKIVEGYQSTLRNRTKTSMTRFKQWQ